MKLSILIPTLNERWKTFDRLNESLHKQIDGLKLHTQVQICTHTAGRDAMTIGQKRNELMEYAQGDYLCFIDDDDRVSDDYLKLILEGVATNPDCCSLNGIYTLDGNNPKPFRHSIEYTEIDEKDGLLRRPPNHLNTIKSSIAKQMIFPDWNYSEDSNYCFQLQRSGLLKVEYKIEPVIYHYLYISDKKRHVYE